MSDSMSVFCSMVDVKGERACFYTSMVTALMMFCYCYYNNVKFLR